MQEKREPIDIFKSFELLTAFSNRSTSQPIHVFRKNYKNKEFLKIFKN